MFEGLFSVSFAGLAVRPYSDGMMNVGSVIALVILFFNYLMSFFYRNLGDDNDRSFALPGLRKFIIRESRIKSSKNKLLCWTNILELAGIISPLDKNSNYDRLFPDQDYGPIAFSSGKGSGKLIALTHQKKALENINSCFIDSTSQIQFENQLSFYKKYKRFRGEINSFCYI
ncbi:MAG: hypothetical protein ABI707_11345 [Ferruginibacter sp.]